jgi:hypothetical protein
MRLKMPTMSGNGAARWGSCWRRRRRRQRWEKRMVFSRSSGELQAAQRVRERDEARAHVLGAGRSRVASQGIPVGVLQRVLLDGGAVKLEIEL